MRRDRRGGGRARRPTAGRARSCPTWCCRRSASTRRSAAWCRRSPRAPMSTRSTASSPRRWRTPNLTIDAIDGVAAAAGPGLIGGVIVGLTTAKAIAMVNGKPLMAINHLEAHALTARLTSGVQFPYCLFLASGGHTQIVAVQGIGDYTLLGTTAGRRDRRGLRQDREAAGAGLSRRPAGGEGGGAGKSRRGLRCRGRCTGGPSRIFRCRG